MPQTDNTKQQRYSQDDLLYLMRRLRDPETGCPWDTKQDWESITPSTIEEAYEVVEAIEAGDKQKIREELGDLLFQIVFYSNFAEEEGAFNFGDVIHGLTDKLIKRHPHVFVDGHLHAQRDKNTVPDEKGINQSWEIIKQQERNARGQSALLDDIPANLPALTRAEKLQKRAARAGFDWEHTQQIVEKIKEELAEFQQEVATPDSGEAEAEELGDLLFSCVNLARFRGVSSEQCVRKANRKFERRITWVEAELARKGLSFEDCSAAVLDQYWRAAKESGL